MQSAFWSISPSRRCPRDQRPDYRDPRPRSDGGPAASSGRHDLDNGYASDPNGVPRLVSAMPTREDYLTLAFDEICQYGIGSVRVMRRLRAALTALSESLTDDDRAGAVRSYLKHLRSRHRAVPARYGGPSRSAGDRPPGPRPHTPDEMGEGPRDEDRSGEGAMSQDLTLTTTTLRTPKAAAVATGRERVDARGDVHAETS